MTKCKDCKYWIKNTLDTFGVCTNSDVKDSILIVMEPGCDGVRESLETWKNFGCIEGKSK